MRRSRETPKPNPINTRRSDPELRRAKQLARLQKQLGSMNTELGRTRQATAMGSIAYQEQIAVEAAQKARKKAKNQEILKHKGGHDYLEQGKSNLGLP